MTIKVAKTAGFCFGVNKAVKEVFKMIDNGEKNLYTLGELIHNRKVTDQFTENGIKILKSYKDAKKDMKVIIRTHGVTKEVYDFFIKNNINYIDLTCPYVKKIHNIVNKHYLDNYDILIIGNKDHPEVIGINGWCMNKAIIGENIEDFTNLDNNRKYCVVVQTTFNKENLISIEKYIDNTYNDIVMFDTVCTATLKRQKEVIDLSKTSNIVFVVGGHNSSNTIKLYELCNKYCNEVYFVESSEEIPQDLNIKNKTIGITAGASTPEWVIKEVVVTLEEKGLNNSQEMMDMEKAIEESMVTLKSKDIVKGTIIKVSDEGVYVDLSYKTEGFIPADELTIERLENVTEKYNVGDEIEAFVVRVSDVEGIVTLSARKVKKDKKFNELYSLYKEKESITGIVKESSNNGLVVDYNSIRIFIPARAVSVRYIENFDEFQGKEVTFKLTEFNRRRNRYTGSIKVIEIKKMKKAKKEFWENVEVGQKIDGIVKTLTPYGAFVQVANGIDGLVHRSELSWTDKNPADVVEVGDKIEVKVLEFDKKTKKISLSCKNEDENPWKKAADTIKVGDILSGKVERLVPFGAFVNIMEGVDGLVHNNELSWNRIKHPSEVLKTGDQIEVKVVSTDFKNNKIGLSFKKQEDNPWVKLKNEYKIGDEVTKKVVSVEPYGAFVNLIDGIDGLIHVSQLSLEKIDNADEVVKVGDEVTAQITEINSKTEKVSLSIRRLLVNEKRQRITQEKKEQKQIMNQYSDDSEMTIGDLLNHKENE